jgi:hypothetical protein
MKKLIPISVVATFVASLLGLALCGGLIYIAAHFIIKFW